MTERPAVAPETPANTDFKSPLGPRRRVARFVAVLAACLIVLGSCGTTTDRGLRSQDWATIGAYQQQVTDLQSRVAVLITAVPTNPPATPTVPFNDGWTVQIAKMSTAPAFPNGNDDPDEPATIEAVGVFLALDLVVVNQQFTPAAQFPWWQLRLRDQAGHIFTPVRAATAGYATDKRNIVRPEQYQPILEYPQAVVFDVPPTLSGVTLTSADGTLAVALPGPIPQPSPAG